MNHPKKQTPRLITGGVVAVAAIVVIFSFVKVPFGPHGDTRIILEHTHLTYISPPCYEQAEKTNNLAETTWEKAQELSYTPESACTEQSLKPIEVPLSYWLMEKLGMAKSKWDW
ncbi:hypothetical protein NDK47_00455 [Brevibacillus ruminantium]|uniref:Uncharacterized protein n=1 Tax=Brevibacillus ruminantium TaxID=2950604 RepID=A0ABY4WFC7_9BACL|nr:hypothetical protein [Brevibacillus ruminantium]USG65863.1 hypothetical protein NDK47_00455 [Brevibacillus ruminantium]